jgi:hypothetical protein
MTIALAVADLFPEILVVPSKLDSFTMNFMVVFPPLSEDLFIGWAARTGSFILWFPKLSLHFQRYTSDKSFILGDSNLE